MSTMDLLFAKGSIIQSFSNVCISLKYITEETLYKHVQKIDDPNNWYPFKLLSELFKVITDSYENPDDIYELLGSETMRIWYNEGEGKDKISTGVDFLHFQTNSEGYSSMIKGPPELTGTCRLEEIDLEAGKAVIFDNTPFNRSFVKGILTGGIKAPGDIVRVDIEYKDYYYHITYEQAY